jgi:hypothetical protein
VGKGEAELQALAARLYSRRGEAVVVPFNKRSVGDWQPIEGDCHRNVDWWVYNHPNSKPVRGWLFFDFRMLRILGGQPFVRFTAHSVVQDEDGTLRDITPSRASQRYPFIRHEGSDEEFISLVNVHQLGDLDLKIT